MPLETASKGATASRPAHAANSHADERTEVRSIRAMWIGLVLAPLLAAAVYVLIPAASYNDAGEVIAGLPHAGRAVAAVGILMATLWVTEALPIPATALLPLALFPLMTGGEVSAREAAAPYASDMIYLFMGGFMIALAMQQWNLHRRIALRTILLVGTQPGRLIAGFMVASAFLSMWVSNTATVVMMLPIATSVIGLVRKQLVEAGDPNAPKEGQPFHFAICLLLGTAFAASVGGVATLIGTPPNLIMAAFLESTYGIKISFAGWFRLALPLVLVFMPCAWLLLVKVAFPVRIKDLPGGKKLIQTELEKQGPMSRGEKVVMTVFVAAALSWVLRPLLAGITIAGVQPLAGLTDSTIAIGAGLVLMGFPVDPTRGIFALTWKQAVKLPWGILILFGGGLSLAAAVQQTGVAHFIGQGMTRFEGLPGWLIVLLVVIVAKMLTEMTSNTATTATLLPILAAVAVGLGMEPTLLVVPMTVAVSWAFLLPVATPPNAIIFGSGEITVPQMVRGGMWLSVLGIVLVMVLYAVIAYWPGVLS